MNLALYFGCVLEAKGGSREEGGKGKCFKALPMTRRQCCGIGTWLATPSSVSTCAGAMRGDLSVLGLTPLGFLWLPGAGIQCSRYGLQGKRLELITALLHLVSAEELGLSAAGEKKHQEGPWSLWRRIHRPSIDGAESTVGINELDTRTT
uniref:Uncharacterized protein n=1 Tax=Timema douglasi TaxID=61478 RepID=A0A7R8VLZ3_TIMDO|nr:unnamed protein product [Timema douglasi]